MMSVSKNVTKDNFRIVGNIEFSGDIKPIQSGIHDLGSPDQRFKDIYLADHLDGFSPRIHFGDFDFSASNVIEARDAAALANTALQPGTVDFTTDIWNLPTTLAGYGITDAVIPGDFVAQASTLLQGSATISTSTTNMIVSGTGEAIFKSDVFVESTTTLADLIITNNINLSGYLIHDGDLVPSTNSASDLGTTSKRYKAAHVNDTLYIGNETFKETDVGTIRDVQNGAYATAAQGALADSALQPHDDIVVNHIALSGHLRGPSTTYIDPEGFGDNTGKVIILGDLQVDGVTTTVNSTSVAVSGKIINLAQGSADSFAANGSGINVNGSGATLKYMAGTDCWTTNKRVGVNYGGSTDVTLSVKQSYTGVDSHDIFHAIDLLDNTRVRISDTYDLILSDTVNDLTILKSDGRVGINIMNPTVSLHVNTADAIMLPRGTDVQRPLTPTQSQRGYIRYNTQSNRFEGFSHGDVWRNLETVSDADRDTYIIAEATDSTDDDTLKFYTDGSVRQRINPVGETNIIVPVPSDEVIKITNSTPSITFNDDSNSGDMHIQWQSSAGDRNGLRFWRDNVTSPDLMISLDGNIGINTAEPETRLHIVDGTIKTEHVAVPKLNLYRNENNRSSDVGHDARGGFWRFDNLGDTFQLRRPDDSYFVVANLNNNKFSIVKDSSRLDFGQWDGYTNRIESSGRELHITSYEDGIYFGENGNKRHYFDNDGEVGINTVTPDGMLTIGNIGAVNDRKVLTFAEGATPSMWFASGLVPTDGDNYMYLDSPHANAHGIMSWKLDGNVGVNITNPVSLFHVVHRETDQSRLVTFKIEREFTPVAANTTQQRFEKAMAIDSRTCNIPADSVENGYRIGLDASCYIADTDFKGYLEQNYGIWARAGAYHNENVAAQQGTGTINNSYAVFVDCLQSDNVTINNSYGIYQAANYTDDPDESKNYFASKVGIGNSSPEAKLHVQHPTTNSVALFESLDANVNIRFRDNATTNDSYIGAIGNDLKLGNVSGGDHVTVKSDGKVGIGTAIPETLLHIRASTSSVNPSKFITLTNYSPDLAENSSLISFQFVDDNENDDPQVQIGAIVGANSNANGVIPEGAGAFIVKTNNPYTATPDSAGTTETNDATDLTERFRVDYRGNVGIGNTNPIANLHIGSSTSDSQWIRLNTQYGTFGIGNGSVDSPPQKYFSIYDNDADQHRLFITNTGKVGIGTTTPDNMLEIDAGTGTDVGMTLRMGTGSSGYNDSFISFQNSQGSELFRTRFDNDNANERYVISSDNGGDTLTVFRSGRVEIQGDSASNATAGSPLHVKHPKNTISMFLGSGEVTSGYGVNDYSGTIRFNGSDSGWGDVSYYPKATGDLDSKGHFRFTKNGSTVSSTPNARVGVGSLYSHGDVQVEGDVQVAGDIQVAGVIQAPTVKGKLWTSNDYVLNTQIKPADFVVMEVVGWANPNTNGHEAYKDPIHLYVYKGTGWNGSALTDYVYCVQISPPARSQFSSGTDSHGNDIDVCWVDANGVETDSCPNNSTTHTLKFKQVDPQVLPSPSVPSWRIRTTIKE